MKLTTKKVKPRFEIVRGDSNPMFPRLLILKGHKYLRLVKQWLEKAHLNCINYRQPLFLLVFCTTLQPIAVF